LTSGKAGPIDDGGADASAEHVDAFAERAAEDEAEDGVAVERILDEPGRAFGPEPRAAAGRSRPWGRGSRTSFADRLGVFIRREEGRHRAFRATGGARRGRGARDVRLAGLQARVHAPVDRDGVGALAPRARAWTVTRRSASRPQLGGERAARSGRRGHQQGVPEGAGGARRWPSRPKRQSRLSSAGLRRPEEPAEVGRLEAVGPRRRRSRRPCWASVRKVVGVERRVRPRAPTSAPRWPIAFQAVVRRERVGLGEATKEVGLSAARSGTRPPARGSG
jgi:hypothetical protein